MKRKENLNQEAINAACEQLIEADKKVTVSAIIEAAGQLGKGCNPHPAHLTC